MRMNRGYSQRKLNQGNEQKLGGTKLITIIMEVLLDQKLQQNLPLDYAVNWTQDNCFRASGTYKGDSLFFKKLLPHEQLLSQGYYDVLNLIICIVDRNCHGNHIVTDALQLQAF